MKRIVLLLMIALSASNLIAQVGIGTTAPEAQLDIRASNQATPANNDGILIPKIDEFPVTDPTAAKDGMMVFASGSGSVAKGFYYWDQGSTSWVSLTVAASDDADWHEQGGSTAPDAITDDLFTQGNVAIGKTTSTIRLDLEDTSGSAAQILGLNTVSTAINTFAVINNLSFGGAGIGRGMITTVSGSGDGIVLGLSHSITNSGAGAHYGVQNVLLGSGTGQQYGVDNTISNSSSATHFGTRNALSGSGGGAKYGSFNFLTGAGNGAHTGVYSSASGGGTGTHYGVNTILSGSGTGIQTATQNLITNSANGSHTGTATTISGGGTGVHTGTINTLSGSGTGFQYGTRNLMTNTADVTHYGVQNSMTGAGNGVQYGLRSDISGTGTGAKYGVYNSITAAGTAAHTATYNSLTGNSSGIKTGTTNLISGTGGGIHYGVNNSLTGIGNGIQYGVNTQMTGTGSGTKFGMRNLIQTTAGGDLYGVYSEVLRSTGTSFAGMFLGNVGIGTTLGNFYVFPASRGAANQVMQTDGSGNLTWVDPSSLDDADWVDNAGDIERQSGDVYIGDTNGTNNDLYLSNRLIDWDNATYLLDLTSDDSKINELEFDDGTAADPSIRFDDTTTGFFSPGADITAYSINSSERLRIDASGRLGIGTNNPQFTVEVAGALYFEDSAFPGSQANHSGLYSRAGELTAVDDAGNQTTLSPHNFSLVRASEPMAWSFYSRHESRQQQINVDMLKMVRTVEALSGTQLVHLADLDGNPIETETLSESLVAQMRALSEENKTLKAQLQKQQEELKAIKLLLEKL